MLPAVVGQDAQLRAALKEGPQAALQQWGVRGRRAGGRDVRQGAQLRAALKGGPQAALPARRGKAGTARWVTGFEAQPAVAATELRSTGSNPTCTAIPSLLMRDVERLSSA